MSNSKQLEEKLDDLEMQVARLGPETEAGRAKAVEWVRFYEGPYFAAIRKEHLNLVGGGYSLHTDKGMAYTRMLRLIAESAISAT